MSEISFRDATDADADALAAIGRATFLATFGALYKQSDLDLYFAEHHNPAEAAALLADPAVAARFAIHDGEVAGFAVIAPSALPYATPGRRTLELKRFYLLPRLHGSRAADAMIAWVFERAHAGGWDDIALSVFSENARARRFYERHGFLLAGPTTYRVGEQLDAEFIMARALA